jgi:hypothetical protein
VYGTGNSVRHLAPVELKERGSETGPCVYKAGARCSNKGFLPMSTVEYLTLHRLRTIFPWPAARVPDRPLAEGSAMLVELGFAITSHVRPQLSEQLTTVFNRAISATSRIDANEATSGVSPFARLCVHLCVGCALQTKADHHCTIPTQQVHCAMSCNMEMAGTKPRGGDGAQSRVSEGLVSSVFRRFSAPNRSIMKVSATTTPAEPFFGSCHLFWPPMCPFPGFHSF